MLKVFLVSAALLHASSTFAQTCEDIFVLTDGHFKNVAQAVDVDAIGSSRLREKPIADITMDDVKLFSSKDGALSAILKTPYRVRRDAIPTLLSELLYKVLGRDLMDAPLAHDIQRVVGKNRSLLQDAKAGKWNEKRKIVQLLQAVQALLREHGLLLDVDLLRADAWYKIFEVSDQTGFDQAIREVKNDQIAAGYELAKQTPDSGDAPIRARFLKYGYDGIDLTRAARKFNGILHTMRPKVVVEQLPQLVRDLHLPKERETHYLELIEYAYQVNLLSNLSTSAKEENRQMMAIYVFEKAFVEAFPTRAPHTQSGYATGVFLNSAIKSVHDFDRVYKMNEINLERNLNDGLALNAQIEKFNSDVINALSTPLARKSQQVSDDIVKIWNEVKALEVKDLDVKDAQFFEERRSRMNVLHFELDQLIERTVVPKLREDSTSFYDLNYKWSRIEEGKSYHIHGKDFDSITFHADVIEFFARDQHQGDRFLHAINKGYVGGYNESGVRMIPHIHKDFRYIKLLKAGGKVRIQGRLIGRALHLFAIFNRDANFEEHETRRLVEHFQP